jgi:signal peptidase II
MFWPVFLTALVFDQLTKLMASIYLEVDLNYGVSFGWLDQLPSEVITALLIFLVVGIAYLLKKEWQRNKAIAGLFWAGVLSNLLDRVLFGGVIDWISLPYVEIKNNLADFYLSIALVLLFIQEFRGRYEH